MAALPKPTYAEMAGKPVCRQCKSKDLSYLVKCTAKNCGQWYCNRRNCGLASDIVSHMMKQDHWEIELHGQSSCSQVVLRCEGRGCKQRRVKFLKFLPNDDGTGIKRICCSNDNCNVFQDLTPEECRAVKPFIHNFALIPPLVGEASLGGKLPKSIMNRFSEEPTTYPRDTEGAAPNKVSEIQIRYSRVEKYALDFLRLVAAEADCDREQKRDQFETDLETSDILKARQGFQGFQPASLILPTGQIKNIKVIEGDLLGLVHFESCKIQRLARVVKILPPSKYDTAKPVADPDRRVLEISVEECRQRDTAMNRGSRSGFHEWETDWGSSGRWADCSSLPNPKNVTVHYIWRRTAFDRMERALKLFAVAWPVNRQVEAQTEIPCIDLELHRAIFGQDTSRFEGAISPWRHDQDRSKCPQVCRNLNGYQMEALEMAMGNTLSLIQGPPGTGKSTTIAAIAYHLVKENGPKILICAPSNTAVGHINDILQGMSKELKNLNVFRVKARTYSCDELERAREISKADIICCTCVAAGGRSLGNHLFETVIVDESTQGIEPAVLIALTMGCKRAILVGDQQQLGPTVLDEASAKANLDQSLFTRLLKRKINKIPYTQLRQQYRMNPTLTNFISACFYDGKLEKPKTYKYAGCADLTRPPLSMPIAFWTHDHPEFLSNQHTRGKSYLNPGEVPKVIQIVEKLLDAGVQPNDIGIVTPYRSQRWQLENALPVKKGTRVEVEVSTIDGYQGREKDFMVVSCVRSEPAQAKEKYRYMVGSDEDRAYESLFDETGREGRTGIGFLTETRRLNVALSRAKHRLFIIGNATVLERYPKWNKLVDYTKTSGCAFNGEKLDEIFVKNTGKAWNRRAMPRMEIM